MQWTETYRPETLDEVEGNPTPVQRLRAWARSWEAGDPDPKALVLSGQAGVGKTSAALALAGEMGWGVVQMNASDRRNEEAVRKVALAGAVHETFGDDGSWGTTREGRMKLIVLDEADNLFGREDYGGAGAMAQVLRETRQPVVLIVNDYYELTRRNPAFRRLAEEVKFRAIHANTVKKVLARILTEEGITAEDEVLDAIADASSGDLRGAINDLEMLCRGRSAVTREDLEVLTHRNVTPSIFQALDKVFHGTDARKAREATFDLDESPEDLVLWIDENLPTAYPEPPLLDAGYEALAKADRYLGRVRRRQEYRFWSYARDLMTAGVMVARGDARAQRGRYAFPEWLKRMSRSRGQRGVRDGLVGTVAAHLHTGPREVLAAHLPFLRHMFAADPEFAAWATYELSLSPEEVAYLLDTTKSTKAVRTVTEAADEVRVQVLGGSRSIDAFEGADAPAANEDEGDDADPEGSEAPPGDRTGEGAGGAGDDAGSGGGDDEEGDEGGEGDGEGGDADQRSLFDY